MILRPFLSNQPFVLALLLPVIVLFQLLNGYLQYHHSFAFVDIGLWGKTTFFNQWWAAIPAGIIVALNAIQLNVLFNRHEFLEKNNYGPSLFYVVFMSFSHSFYQFDALLIVHACLLQVIRILFTMRTGEDNRKEAFNAAFFIGLACTFLPPTGFFIVILWFAVWALKSFVFREWLIMILGFSTPVFNGLMFWWISGHRITLNMLRNNTFIDYEVLVYYSTSAIVILLLIFSFIGIRVRMRKSSIRFKKLSRVLIWFLIGAIIIGVSDLVFYQQVEWFNLVFIPVSFFFTFAFIHKFWKVAATSLFYIAFVLAVIKFFGYTHLLM